MRTRPYLPVLLTAALCASIVGYGIADAYDVVPGIITTQSVSARNHIPTLPGSLATVELPADSAPAPSEIDNAKLNAARETLAGHVKAAGGRLAINLVDAESGETVFSDNPQTPMTPASTTKLFTTMTALRLLDPNKTFTTTTALEGNTLYLRGDGDITLGSGKSNPNAVMGRAGLETLAHETALALRGKVDAVEVKVDESAIAGPQRNPVWTEDDLDNYSGNVAALAIAQGRAKADTPKYFSTTPVMDAAKVFVDKLQAEGVTVLGHPEMRPQTPGAEVLATVKSAPFSQLLQYVGKTSDNTLAEQFCRVMASRLGANADFSSPAGQLVKQFSQRGLDMKGVTLNDCSGLNKRNQIPAQALTQVIRESIQDPQMPTALVLADLPVAGWDGTLHNRYRKSAAAGLVRAKTGSLSGVRSLAGIIRTQSGKNLIFAVLIDQCDPEKTWGLKTKIDEFLSVVETL